MAARYFVAGTDTGVGKTRVTCGLLAAARAAGRRVAGMKPVSAGLIDVNGRMINEDVVEIMASSGQIDLVDQVNPFALDLPVSPHIAAQRQHIELDIGTITTAARGLATGRELLLIEGAGGWHAPISAATTMADVAVALQAPVLLVVGLKLGCLNHARLTREAIERSGLALAGWIGSEIEQKMPEIDENRRYLDILFGEPALGWLPYSPDRDADAQKLGGALPRLLQVRASL
ncbi:MAG: dethiobiotin synthase [Pseudomonadota bacterium]|jgi:dethiobiotin synthetase